MRIKEFSIRWYGPLVDTGRVALGNFSLLFGKNEDGKTLTIDALVKLLFQRGRRLFDKIDRVDQDPDGYIIIEEGGEEVKLPEKGDLASITDLTPEECCNIFIIRNSNLSIALESEFYRNVTDRLTGLKTQEISCIKDELAELGKLTKAESTAILRNRAGEKIKSRAESAQQLIAEVETLEGKVKEEEFDKLEEALLNVRERISETNSELQALEDARKREKYEKGSEAYRVLMGAQQNLRKLEVYSNEDAKLWDGCERDIRNWQGDIEELRSEVNGKKSKLEQKQKAFEEKRLETEILRERKARIDNEIKPQTVTYEMGVGKVTSAETRSRFFTAGAITSAVLLSISILGLILSPSPFFYGLFALFLISCGIFGALRFSFTREKAHLAAVFERIKLAASTFEIAGEDIQEILSNIQKFDEDYSKKEKEKEEAAGEVSLLGSEIKHLTEVDIAALERKTGEVAGKIENLVQKSGVTTLRQYNQKLQLKLGHETSVETQRGILESHFRSRGENLEEDLSFWHDEIETLKDFECKATDITYDENIVSGLKTNQENLLKEEEELEDKAAGFYEQLREIERKANDILQLTDDRLYCATSVDLEGIRDKLSGFIDGVETEKTNALSAIWVFEGLEQKEEEKISELFGKDSPVSRHFRDITDGVYEEVDFVLDDIKEVRVRLQDNSTLAANKLSGGAYDQLYLSIRLALGEKLLKGTKGFFVLDDPFIKADKERLQRQIDILKQISESGWQIIYFTAKEEIRDVLRQEVESGKVNYVELHSRFRK